MRTSGGPPGAGEGYLYVALLNLDRTVSPLDRRQPPPSAVTGELLPASFIASARVKIQTSYECTYIMSSMRWGQRMNASLTCQVASSL